MKKNHSVENRIVSISQSYVRPIVRGKAKSPVEFGAKLDLSVDEQGMTRVEKLLFDAYNEAEVLKTAAVIGASGYAGEAAEGSIAPGGFNLGFGMSSFDATKGAIIGTGSLEVSVSAASFASAGAVIAGTLTVQGIMYSSSFNNNNFTNKNFVKSSNNTSSGSSKTSQGSLSSRCEVNSQISGNTGRGKNNIKPDTNAQGSHSVYKRDPNTGKITNYKTYEPNPKNPSGFDEIIGYDGVVKSHVNKATGESLMPHVHDKTVPGGVSEPYTYKIPK